MLEPKLQAASCHSSSHCSRLPYRGPDSQDAHHLIQGVAQEAVLVEDEEPPLPFLQESRGPVRRPQDWALGQPPPPLRNASPLTSFLELMVEGGPDWGTLGVTEA